MFKTVTCVPRYRQFPRHRSAVFAPPQGSSHQTQRAAGSRAALVCDMEQARTTSTPASPHHPEPPTRGWRSAPWGGRAPVQRHPQPHPQSRHP